MDNKEIDDYLNKELITGKKLIKSIIEKDTQDFGQITMFTEFGKKIYELVKHPEVKNILDIGTTYGMGTTKCIFEGIIHGNKKDFQVISIECRKDRVEKAKLNLLYLPLKNFNIIHGTIITFKELYPLLKEFPNNDWLKDDLKTLKTTPYVFDILPDKLDLIIIDGGDFSGWMEFNKLWKRSRFIVLDDSRSNKNYESYKFILNNLNIFKIIYNTSLRGGEMICENLNYETT